MSDGATTGIGGMLSGMGGGRASSRRMFFVSKIGLDLPCTRRRGRHAGARRAAVRTPTVAGFDSPPSQLPSFPSVACPVVSTAGQVFCLSSFPLVPGGC